MKRIVVLQTWVPRPRPGEIIAHAQDQQNSKDYGNFPGIDAGSGQPAPCSSSICSSQDIVSIIIDSVTSYVAAPGAMIGPVSFIPSGSDYLPPTPASRIQRVWYDGIQATQNIHYTTNGIKITPMSGLLAGTEVEATYIAA